MENSPTTLYIEINNINFIFFVGKNDAQNNFKIAFKLHVSLRGVENGRISNLEEFFNTIKENIYLVEKKCNYTFKEVILILDNFNPSFLCLSGFKRLNSSQVLRENITYILNTLKSYIDKVEFKKTILHIFNSKFILDNKEIENLPIGLFGDFYSHELAFTLINTNDYKNLNNIFAKCNLKIKKILIKSFIKGVYLSNHYKNIDTFFHITMNEHNTKIFYFENNSLKFEQSFKFGTNIILKDISKITLLKIDKIKMILNEIELSNQIQEDELLEDKFFDSNEHKKIKKKLIFEIAFERIKEIFEIILIKNINFSHYNKNSKVIFLEISNELQFKGLKEIFKIVYPTNEIFDVNFVNNLSKESLLNTANRLVHFGWQKEAIPVTHQKKSVIRGFFDTIFGR